MGLWVSGSNNEAIALVADWSNTQQFDCYAICDSKETGDHGECYLYGHRTSSWLFIRIVSIQSHRIVLLTHPLLYIATPGHVAKIWEFSSAGGPTWTCVQGVLSCPSVRWGGLSGRAFRGALATLVLDVAQSHIYISACACVGFVWPHCLRALMMAFSLL